MESIKPIILIVLGILFGNFIFSFSDKQPPSKTKVLVSVIVGFLALWLLVISGKT